MKNLLKISKENNSGDIWWTVPSNIYELQNLLKISKENNSADIWWTVTLNIYELLDIMV